VETFSGIEPTKFVGDQERFAACGFRCLESQPQLRHSLPHLVIRGIAHSGKKFGYRSAEDRFAGERGCDRRNVSALLIPTDLRAVLGPEQKRDLTLGKTGLPAIRFQIIVESFVCHVQFVISPTSDWFAPD
jgi:hypothetical protein